MVWPTPGSRTAIERNSTHEVIAHHQVLLVLPYIADATHHRLLGKTNGLYTSESTTKRLLAAKTMLSQTEYTANRRTNSTERSFASDGGWLQATVGSSPSHKSARTLSVPRSHTATRPTRNNQRQLHRRRRLCDVVVTCALLRNANPMTSSIWL